MKQKKHNQRRKKVQARKANNNTKKGIQNFNLTDYTFESLCEARMKAGDIFFYINGIAIGRTKALYSGFIPKAYVEEVYEEVVKDFEEAKKDYALTFNDKGEKLLERGMVMTIQNNLFDLLENCHTNLKAVAMLMSLQKYMSKDTQDFTHMAIGYEPLGAQHSWGSKEEVVDMLKQIKNHERAEFRAIDIQSL